MVPTMNKNEHFSVSCLNELKLVGVDWYDIRSVPTPQVVLVAPSCSERPQERCLHFGL